MKSKETNEYIVSWLEETKKATRGNFEIKVYDDEGYAAVRKVTCCTLIVDDFIYGVFFFQAQRNGEDSTTVQPLGVVILNHPVSSPDLTNFCQLSKQFLLILGCL